MILRNCLDQVYPLILYPKLKKNDINKDLMFLLGLLLNN